MEFLVKILGYNDLLRLLILFFRLFFLLWTLRRIHVLKNINTDYCSNKIYVNRVVEMKLCLKLFIMTRVTNFISTIGLILNILCIDLYLRRFDFLLRFFRFWFKFLFLLWFDKFLLWRLLRRIVIIHSWFKVLVYLVFNDFYWSLLIWIYRSGWLFLWWFVLSIRIYWL